MSRSGITRAGLVTALALPLILGTGGCGESRKQGRPQTSAPAAVESLDVYRPGDVEFFSRFQMHGALLLEPPASVADAAKGTRAVVVARVADVRVTRTIGAGVEAQPMVGVVLDVSEVVHGKLKGDLDETVVEFAGDQTSPEDPVKELRAGLPQGEAVWFLHLKGDGAEPKPDARPISAEERKYYRLLHLDGGLLVQGPEGVVAPTSEHFDPRAKKYDENESPPGRSLLNDSKKYKTLGSLVKEIKAIS